MDNLDLGELPNPLIIYEEEHPGKPGKPEAKGKWKLIGFLFQSELKGYPSPSSEIPAIIKIPEELYRNSIEGLDRDQIESRGEIITQRPLPEEFYAKPKFSAKVMLDNFEEIDIQ